MEIITAKINGFEMKAAVMGEGAGTFVILPGLSPKSALLSARSVERAYSGKLPDTRICLVDRREEVPIGYTVYDMAEDTAAALKEMGIRKAAVLGLSQGGIIAMLLAAKHPELVSMLIPGSTSARTTPSIRRAAERWVALAEAGEGDRLADRLVTDICSERLAGRFGPILSAGMKGLTKPELARFATLARTLYDFDIEPLTGAISCPALVIGAEGDRVMTAAPSRRLAELLHAELYLYGPEYGHNVYDEAPDYAGRVAEFINRNTAGSL